MSSTWNNNIGFTVFGESHGPAIGVVMDNVPPGESIDLDKIYQFMARRAPKQNKTSTQRKEKDMPQIWQSFYRGDTSHKRDSSRFGLGLSIVSAIMKLYGHKCGVYNTEDGVCFWFEADSGEK